MPTANDNNLKMSYDQRQEQKTQLSQRMIQSAQILQMDVQELSVYLQNLAQENPMIDMDDMERDLRKLRENAGGEPEQKADDWNRRLEWLSQADEQNRIYYSAESEERNLNEDWNISLEENPLSDYLMSQLILECKNKKDRTVMEYLIGSLDERGYLTENAAELAELLNPPSEEVRRYIHLLQNTEPAGVGAFDLSECLTLQLNRLHNAGKLSTKEHDLAAKMVESYLEDLSKQHYERIMRTLSVTREEIDQVLSVLHRLNPIPGNSFGSRRDMRYIRPDVTVVKFAGYFEVLVNEMDFPKISENPYYAELLNGDSPEEVKEYLSIKQKQLQWVRQCIRERSETLRRVTIAIVKKQESFFDSVNGAKSPLGLKELAEDLSLHESTISRALKNKFLQCQRGVYPMSYFLVRTASRKTGNASVGVEEIKRQLRELIDQEDKGCPLSDRELSDKLQALGYSLSRRTVAKYRAEMLIADASARKSAQNSI